MEKRLNSNMTMAEIIRTMSGNNPKTMECMSKLIYEPTFFKDTQLLDTFNLYDSTLEDLWVYCCNEDINKLTQTLRLFRNGEFSKKEIHERIEERKSFV